MTKTRYIPFAELLDRARKAAESDWLSASPIWAQQALRRFFEQGETIPRADKAFRAKLSRAVVAIEDVSRRRERDLVVHVNRNTNTRHTGKTEKTRGKKKYYCPCVPRDERKQPIGDPECSTKPDHDRKVRSQMQSPKRAR